MSTLYQARIVSRIDGKTQKHFGKLHEWDSVAFCEGSLMEFELINAGHEIIEPAKITKHAVESLHQVNPPIVTDMILQVMSSGEQN